MTSGSSQTNFGFTGEYGDSDGLLYLRARYYNPTLGQFFSLDPVETPNRYSYVGGNVVNRRDPSGLLMQCPQEVPEFICQLVETGEQDLSQLGSTLPEIGTSIIENPATATVVGAVSSTLGALTIAISQTAAGYAAMAEAGAAGASAVAEAVAPGFVLVAGVLASPFALAGLTLAAGGLLLYVATEAQLPNPYATPGLWETMKNNLPPKPSYKASQPKNNPYPQGQPAPDAAPQAPTSPNNDKDKKTYGHTHISLGYQTRPITQEVLLFHFTFNLNNLLNPYGIRVVSFQDWGVLGAPEGVFSAAKFAVASENAEAIHFNLEDIGDPIGLATAAGTAFNPSLLTGWELGQIMRDPKLCAKTLFWDNGSNPLTMSVNMGAKATICGASSTGAVNPAKLVGQC